MNARFEISDRRQGKHIPRRRTACIMLHRICCAFNVLRKPGEYSLID